MSEDINNPLTASQKSFKIFRIIKKDGEYFDKNIRLNRISGICFTGFCDNRNDLSDIVKKLFGNKGYNQFFTNYIYDFKFIYKPSFYSDKKVIIKNEKQRLIDEMSILLPNLKRPPSYVYNNNKNSILDYTEQLKLMIPNNEILIKSPVLKYSELIIPEVFIRLFVDSDNPDMIKWCNQYKSTNNNPFININHDTIIVSFNIDTTSNELITMFLDYNKNIPLNIKKDINKLRIISFCRFLYRAYVNDIEDLKEDDPIKYFIKSFNEKNVIILFHNKSFSFSVNFRELRSKKVNFRQFYNQFKTRLITLISNNLGIQSDDSLDEMILSDEKHEKVDNFYQALKLELNKETSEKEIEKDELIKTNDEIIDEDKSIKDKKIENIIKKDLSSSTNIIKQSVNNSKTEKIISKLNTDNNSIKNIENDMSAISDDQNQPIEDIESDQEAEDEIVLLEEDMNDENESRNNDDIPEDLLEDEKVDVEITSTGSLSDEEKKELLKEINKKQVPKKSEKQLRRIAQVRDAYKSIKLEDNRTLEEIINDTESEQIDSKISRSDNILDKSVETCTLKDFERSYIQKTFKSDIIKTFKSFSDDSKSIPLNIIDYKEEDTSDRFNSKTTITVKFEDDNQKQHTIKIDIPKPDKDGTMLINGNKKILKKQITLLPLIKIQPDKLAINTYYNKVLMYRQGTVLNRKVVIIKKLVESYLVNDKDKVLFSVKYGNNISSNKNFITTIEYDELAKNYHKYIVGPKNNRTVIFFNQNEIRDEIKRLNILYENTVNKLPIAIDYGKLEVLYFNMKDTVNSVGDIILKVFEEKSGLVNINEIINKIKPPKKRIYSKITIQSYEIPTVVFLGALYGIRNVMKVNNLKFTFSSKPLRNDNRLTIKFKDGILYYPEYPFGNSLLFNGLSEIPTEEFNFDDFDTPDPYIEWAYLKFKNRNIYKGWTCFKELFIDIITREILEKLKLPTDFLELFLYANEMLTDNTHANETKAENYRIRGYETICVGLYKALAHEYAIYKQKESKGKSGISLPQDILYTTLTGSEILENYDTINPINELKMSSICTFKGVGVGGSNVKHGFSLNRRAFGEDATGIFSASNVDNGSVGITKELTNSPRILSTRGFLDPTDTKAKQNELTIAERLSPEELIMPAINKYDHPNRVAFSSAQWKHTLPIYGGGDPPLIGSGYEKTMVKQIGDTFSLKSSKDGVVTNINEEYNIITVEYKDGTKETFKYGRDFIRNSNFFLENNLKLNVKVGQKVKENDILAYSEEFFTKTVDNDLSFTMGGICKVALMDDYFTEEDSSLISKSLSNRLSTSVTKKKSICISGKSNIIKYAKVGEYVKDGDSIFLFEDESDEDDSTVNEILEMLDVDEETMENMAYHSPKANSSGTITKLNVIWTGELEDMSDSCRKFVSEYIKQKKSEIKYEESETGKKSNRDYEFKKATPKFGRIGTDELGDNGILIEYYITHVTSYEIGDKLSFYPAIKSVTAQILPENQTPYTESGDNIDAVMGLISLSARQVNSPYFLGSLGKILFDMSKKIASEYLGK